MIRRFNYTGRVRIERKDITIRRSRTASVGLDATWSLSAYSFPGDAIVIVEAQIPGATARRRFECGRVASPVAPTGEPLTDSDLGAAYFDLLVVAPDVSGRLLGSCRRLYADDVTSRQSPLLPVRQMDLGQEVWRLDFDPESEGRPTLLINSRVDDSHEIARTDPLFASLVFPEVVRRVLTTIIIDQETSEVDDEDTRTSALWLRWAISLSPTGAVVPRATRGSDNAEARLWIEDVVRAFCSDQRFAERASQAWREAQE